MAPPQDPEDLLRAAADAQQVLIGGRRPIWKMERAAKEAKWRHWIPHCYCTSVDQPVGRIPRSFLCNCAWYLTIAVCRCCVERKKANWAIVTILVPPTSLGGAQPGLNPSSLSTPVDADFPHPGIA